MTPKLNNNHFDVIALMAHTYLRNALYDKAETLLLALEQLKSGERRTLQALACVRLNTGRPEAALEAAIALLAKGHTDPVSHLLRGLALAQLGRVKEAGSAMQAYRAARIKRRSKTIASKG